MRGQIRVPLLAFCLALACAEDEADEPCHLTGDACGQAASLFTQHFSLLTLRRLTGPDRDLATWRFEVDELTCTLTHAEGRAHSSCRRRDDASGDPVPPLVVAEISSEGFGRLFRVDTLGRAKSHVRVFRDETLVDEIEHVPAASSVCGEGARIDLGPIRDLPATP